MTSACSVVLFDTQDISQVVWGSGDRLTVNGSVVECGAKVLANRDLQVSEISSMGNPSIACRIDASGTYKIVFKQDTTNDNITGYAADGSVLFNSVNNTQIESAFFTIPKYTDMSQIPESTVKFIFTILTNRARGTTLCRYTITRQVYLSDYPLQYQSFVPNAQESFTQTANGWTIVINRQLFAGTPIPLVQYGAFTMPGTSWTLTSNNQTLFGNNDGQWSPTQTPNIGFGIISTSALQNSPAGTPVTLTFVLSHTNGATLNINPWTYHLPDTTWTPILTNTSQPHLQLRRSLKAVRRNAISTKKYTSVEEEATKLAKYETEEDGTNDEIETGFMQGDDTNSTSSTVGKEETGTIGDTITSNSQPIKTSADTNIYGLPTFVQITS